MLDNNSGQFARMYVSPSAAGGTVPNVAGTKLPETLTRSASFSGKSVTTNDGTEILGQEVRQVRASSAPSVTFPGGTKGLAPEMAKYLTTRLAKGESTLPSQTDRKVYAVEENEFSSRLVDAASQYDQKLQVDVAVQHPDEMPQDEPVENVVTTHVQDEGSEAESVTEENVVTTHVQDEGSEAESVTENAGGLDTRDDCEKTVADTSDAQASDIRQKTEKTIVEFHKPNWKERLVATVRNVGSMLRQHFQTIHTVVKVAIWTPLNDFVITPLHTVLLYLFQPDAYNAKILGLKVQSRMAANELKQANNQALEKGCVDLAKAGHTQETLSCACYVLAQKFGAQPQDVLKRVQQLAARADVNQQFHEQLANGKLTLKKVVTSPEGNRYKVPHVVLPASDRVRDADKADVAKRLGSDPEALEKYNKAVDDYKAAAQNDVELSVPELKSVSNLTSDPIPQMRVDYAEARANLNRNIIDNTNKLKDRYAQQGWVMPSTPPGNLKNPLGLGVNAEAYSDVKAVLDAIKYNEIIQSQALKWMDDHLEKKDGYESGEGNVELIIAHYECAIANYELARNIDKYEVALQLLDQCETENNAAKPYNSRLNTQNWNLPVFKDENGVKIESNTPVLDAAHQERTFDQMIHPIHNGRTMPNPVSYGDQQGLEWKRVSADKTLGGDDHVLSLYDPEAQVSKQVSNPLKNHWVVQSTDANGAKNPLPFADSVKPIPVVNFAETEEMLAVNEMELREQADLCRQEMAEIQKSRDKIAVVISNLRAVIAESGDQQLVGDAIKYEHGKKRNLEEEKKERLKDIVKLDQRLFEVGQLEEVLQDPEVKEEKLAFALEVEFTKKAEFDEKMDQRRYELEQLDEKISEAVKRRGKSVQIDVEEVSA